MEHLEGDDIGGDLEPPKEQVTVEAQRKEDSPEETTPVDLSEEPTSAESLSETTDGGVTLAEVLPSNDLREISLSCVTDWGDREKVEEMARMNDRAMERLRDDEHWGQPPEENDGGATAKGGGAATEELPNCELEEFVFSLAAVSCDTEREEVNRLGLDGALANWI